MTDEEENEYKCGFCHRGFDSWTRKFRHRCKRRPRTVCKYEHCSDAPIDDAGFCRKHRPKPFQTVYGLKDNDITEEVKGIYEATFHYAMEETVRVEGFDEHHAEENAEMAQTYDAELIHTPHVDVRKVGEKTTEQVHISNVVETDKGKIKTPKTTLKDFNED